MTNQVTPDRVKSFTWEACQENPCRHTCEIALNDGTKIKKLLSGDQIYTVIKEINQKVNTSHFKSCQPITRFSYEWCCCPMTYQLTATDVLTELFETALSLQTEKTPFYS